MACDDDNLPVLTRGSVWVWNGTIDGDGSTLSDLLVQLRANSVLIASSDPDDEVASIVTTGGFDDAVPATDMPGGVLAFYLPADDSAAVAANVIELGIRVKENGVDEITKRRTYRVVGDPAVRLEEVGS